MGGKFNDKVKKERYFIKQDNTVYTFSIKVKNFKYRSRKIKITETNKKVTYHN